MATTGQMMAAGIADLVCTVVLIWFAFLGSKIYTPLLSWAFSIKYASPPPINPGLFNWAFAGYYGLLICCWIAIQVAMYFLVMNRAVYQYPG